VRRRDEGRRERRSWKRRRRKGKGRDKRRGRGKKIYEKSKEGKRVDEEI
jgi:hypothetical protein